MYKVMKFGKAIVILNGYDRDLMLRDENNNVIYYETLESANIMCNKLNESHKNENNIKGVID